MSFVAPKLLPTVAEGIYVIVSEGIYVIVSEGLLGDALDSDIM